MTLVTLPRKLAPVLAALLPGLAFALLLLLAFGLLAAVAIPKFVDLGSEARDAAMKGVTGALSSAAAVNYAARKASPTKGRKPRPRWFTELPSIEA